MQSLASCIVSTHAGLTQGSERRLLLRLALHLAGWPETAARTLQPAVWISELGSFFASGTGHQDTFHVRAFTQAPEDRTALLDLCLEIQQRFLLKLTSHLRSVDVGCETELDPQAEADVPTVGTVKGFYLLKIDQNNKPTITRLTRKRSDKVNNLKTLDSRGTKGQDRQGRSKIQEETHRPVQRRRLDTCVLSLRDLA